MTSRVLLADDHEFVKDGLRGLLATQPQLECVGAAADGREAVDLAVALRPDVVIMDVTMPGLNGVEATREIVRQVDDVRVIALSMHVEVSIVQAVLDAGARGYVPKSAPAAELLQAIEVALAGGIYLSDSIRAERMRDRAGRRGRTAVTLGAREREVIQLVAEGRTSKEIARILHVAKKTVDNTRHAAMKKLGLGSIAELTRYAIKHGLTPLQ